MPTTVERGCSQDQMRLMVSNRARLERCRNVFIHNGEINSDRLSTGLIVQREKESYIVPQGVKRRDEWMATEDPSCIGSLRRVPSVTLWERLPPLGSRTELLEDKNGICLSSQKHFL